LNLLLKSPNSARIEAIAEYLGIYHKFPIAKIEMIHRISLSFSGVTLIALFKICTFY